MDAPMVGRAVVVAFVRTAALDTNQVAGTALRPAEFDAGPQIYNGTVEYSA